jgi:hypothetical protein
MCPLAETLATKVIFTKHHRGFKSKIIFNKKHRISLSFLESMLGIRIMTMKMKMTLKKTKAMKKKKFDCEFVLIKSLIIHILYTLIQSL